MAVLNCGYTPSEKSDLARASVGGMPLVMTASSGTLNRSAYTAGIVGFLIDFRLLFQQDHNKHLAYIGVDESPSGQYNRFEVILSPLSVIFS